MMTPENPRVGYLHRVWAEPPGLALLLLIKPVDLTGLLSPALSVRYTHGPDTKPVRPYVWETLTLCEPCGLPPQAAREREERLWAEMFPNPRAQLRWVQVPSWNITPERLAERPVRTMWRLSEVRTEHL